MSAKRTTPSARKAAFNARRAEIAKHYATMSNADIGKMLGMTAHRVGQEAGRMGIKKPPPVKVVLVRKEKYSPWNDTNLLLDALYATTRTSELAELLGMPVAAVYQAANKRGLAKDKELCAQWISETKRATRLEKQTERPNAEQQFNIKGPPPMNQAQIAQREKERFSYPPDALPWRAQAMQGPAWVPPPMTYRGQTQRSTA